MTEIRKVFKYGIKLISRVEQKIDIPCAHKILDVQMQGNDLVFWAAVDSDTKIDAVIFVLLMTGATVDLSSHTHIKTLQVGELVWHLFMRHYK